jgi:Zn-dependent protease with chaperone function
MDALLLKGPCQQCGTNLEFPPELAGQTIDCPVCKQATLLEAMEVGAVSEDASPGTAISAPELLALFSGTIKRPRASFLYSLGLGVVAFAMVLLPIIYVGLIGLVAWGVYAWGFAGTSLFSGHNGARIAILKGILYVAPLFAGVVLVFFMVKPLFARRPKAAQPLALNPAAEPTLFAFIAKICDTVGAPFPKRVDLDCHLNASASFRRGIWSLFSNDLVLTIGLPLVAGLNVTQFAGVLAHEFGHFTQGFGMRLTYVIRSVNSWFFRVAYERDRWDETLEEWAETENSAVAILVGTARFAVWCSRLVLKLLMYIGHGIGCFMLRQMEFNADSYEIKLAGSEAFESGTRRIHVLSRVTELAYKKMRVGWNQSRELPESLPAYLLRTDTELRDAQRTQLEDTLGLHKSGLFDTHPSHGDRIRAARRAADAGVFQCELPATVLFSNFEVPARHVTVLHYEDDLGIPVMMARLVPLLKPEKPAEEPAASPGPLPQFGDGRLRIRR